MTTACAARPAAKPTAGRLTRTGARALTRLATLLLVAVVFALAFVRLAWHVQLSPVLTGSMRPTYGPGWAIVTRAIPVQQVRPGEILVFRPPGSHLTLAHRVTSVSGPAARPVITTKGDANPAPDPWHARIDGRTVPEVVFAIPWLGRVMVAFDRTWVRLLATLLLGLVLCLAGIRLILRGGSSAAPPASTRMETTA